jgi:predicted RNase H-like HicB family nuclease
MKFVVAIEQDKYGIFVVEYPSIPGCVSQGKTEQKGLENIEV